MARKQKSLATLALNICQKKHFFHFSELTAEVISEFSDDFYSDPKNIFAQNVATRFNPFEASLSRKTIENVHHVFTSTVRVVVVVDVVVVDDVVVAFIYTATLKVVAAVVVHFTNSVVIVVVEKNDIIVLIAVADAINIAYFRRCCIFNVK